MTIVDLDRLPIVPTLLACVVSGVGNVMSLMTNYMI